MFKTHKAKQYSVLSMNTLAFTVNFAIWTIFSIIGIKIKGELNLSDTEFGILVATPILTGSLVRLPLGIFTDKFGGRIVYFIQMILVAIPTYGLSFADQYWQYLVIGLFVGLAGGSFAIGIAYTSAWFEKEKQGTAMGIFGAGNAGAAVTNLVAPIIVVAAGWRAVPEIYSISMLIMAVIFWFFTYPDPQHSNRKAKKITLAQQLAPLAEARVWRYGLAYYFVFGGFVALALWLPKYYVGEFNLTLKEAALITMFFTLPSGVVRALGGWISDKWGGDKTTWWVFWVSVISLFFISYPPTTMTVHGIKADIAIDLSIGVTLFTILIFIIGIAQGIGKASVYRSLADYYPNNMGSVGGMVGVIGGLGGFSMPIMFGIASDIIGVRSSCFMLMFFILAGVMIWTWIAARSEREAILSKDKGLRDELVKKHLIGGSGAKHWISNWKPDNDTFWQEKGKAIAYRNLAVSMPSLLLAFAVWVVWSIIVVELPKAGFKFSTSQLFWLAALPGLSGALLRLLYSFVVPIFGGRSWAIFSTTSLLLPTLWIGIAVQNPDTNYVVFVIIALLCGFGGGNFSSNMGYMSFFFPKKHQGTALGLNAGVGNLGVGLAQAIVPIIIYGGSLALFGGDAQVYVENGVTKEIWLQNAGFIWVPFIILSLISIWFGMDNIAKVKASFSDQVVIFKEKHSWIISWLYTGSFGSFIGMAAAFPMLLNSQFPQENALGIAFVAPLIGALVRPIGGWLSDKYSGASITFWVFIVMAIAAIVGFNSLPSIGNVGNFNIFFAAYLLLFIMAGIGNGSIFKMISSIFNTLFERRKQGQINATYASSEYEKDLEISATLGFSASIAALGGFFIPVTLALSISIFGNVNAAIIIQILFYLSCIFATWNWYNKKDAEIFC